MARKSNYDAFVEWSVCNIQMSCNRSNYDNFSNTQYAAQIMKNKCKDNDRNDSPSIANSHNAGISKTK